MADNSHRQVSWVVYFWLRFWVDMYKATTFASFFGHSYLNVSGSFVSKNKRLEKPTLLVIPEQKIQIFVNDQLVTKSTVSGMGQAISCRKNTGQEDICYKLKRQNLLEDSGEDLIHIERCVISFFFLESKQTKSSPERTVKVIPKPRVNVNIRSSKVIALTNRQIY